MKIIRKLLPLSVAFMLTVIPMMLMAQTQANATGETLWTTGKINVVIIIAAVIFSGIALFLIVLERKISGLEKKITNKN